MDYFQIDHLVKNQENTPYYHEFLRRSSMSAGIYTLPPGTVDPQEPHNEDELYFVLNGSAVIEVDGESQSVSSGSAVFVPAMRPHKFMEIAEELRVLVFFSPAEGTGS